MVNKNLLIKSLMIKMKTRPFLNDRWVIISIFFKQWYKHVIIMLLSQEANLSLTKTY